MRKFLVVLDDTRECGNALRFATLRAANTGGGVILLSIIQPQDFGAWGGVVEIMRAEAREKIEREFSSIAKWMRENHGVEPELVVREGDPVTCIFDLVAEEPKIGILVLAASAEKSGPGPILTALMRQAGALPFPITIVPGDMSKEKIAQMA